MFVVFVLCIKLSNSHCILVIPLCPARSRNATVCHLRTFELPTQLTQPPHNQLTMSIYRNAEQSGLPPMQCSVVPAMVS